MQAAVNPEASREARELLNYLSDIAGKKIITGQHTQTNPMEERAYICEKTGKLPKLVGFELLSCSPNINYEDASEECLKEIYENRGTLAAAMKLAKSSDVILTFTFHWYSPLGGRDKSFYTEHTDFDAEKVLVDGTPERTAFYRDMDVIAEQLKKFRDEKIPILWRPFHESHGQWFWWGAKGPAVARELYKLMFRYYTEHHHLDNLLWVWNCPLAEGYPGDEYVDVISTDIYLTEYAATDYAKEYEELVAQTTGRKVAALAEIGYLPDIKMLEQSHTPWAYYMIWSHEFCIGEQFNKTDALRAVYDSDYAVTAEPVKDGIMGKTMLIKPDHKYLQYSGRVDDTDPEAYLFVYPATLVTIRFRGTGISAYLENHRQFWENYMGVLLDGAQRAICLAKGAEDADAEVRRFVLAEGLEDAEHTLTLFKRQDSCHIVFFRGFELPEGSEVLEPLPKPGLRMEVYGDSVSAGEVSEAVEYAGKPDPEHNGEYSNAWYSYAWMTARKLGAELHDIAQGGIALLEGTGYFNAPAYTGMEQVWDRLQYNPALGAVTDWEFARYTPHVVVVAIGQNDSYPEDYMKNDPDGWKAAVWKRHYRSFVGKLREVYPEALIVLATTILNHDRSWDDAIGEVCKAVGDDRIVHFCYRRNGCGTPGHIRIGEAEEMSDELAAFLSARLAEDGKPVN